LANYENDETTKGKSASGQLGRNDMGALMGLVGFAIFAFIATLGLCVAEYAR